MAMDADRAIAADDLLIGFVSAMLEGEKIALPAVDDPRWPELMSQLMTHRVAGLVGKTKTLGSWPAPAQAALRDFRDLTTRMNGSNLVSMRRILPAFREAKIDVLVFKGPVIQQSAYGDLFARPSSDIDLLVAPSDFDRAAALLDSLGYGLADRCRSLWWRLFLGERHFLPRRPGEATIDLHLRLQQPGAPQPKLGEAFLAARSTTTIAGQPCPVLSDTHQALLCAISYVKALHHREPALRYVIDLLALERRMSAEQMNTVDQEAKRQGLWRSLALSRRAGLLISAPEAAAPHGAPLPEVSQAQLRSMTLRPLSSETEWPKRRRLLQALCDTPMEVPAAFVFMAGGEAARRVFERPAPAQ